MSECMSRCGSDLMWADMFCGIWKKENRFEENLKAVCLGWGGRSLSRIGLNPFSVLILLTLKGPVY